MTEPEVDGGIPSLDVSLGFELEQDVNFDEVLREKVGRGDAPTTDQPDEPTTDEESAGDGPRRDPETGRFLANEEPEVYEDDEESEDDESEDDQVDDLEQFIQERFQGDPKKMAQAYRELEQLKGRQGDELGDLRRQVQDMATRLEQGAYAPQQQQQQVQITQETIDALDQAAMESPERAALWAIDNDPSGMLFERVMDTWFEQNPRQAARFETNLALLQQEDSLLSQMSPILDATERTTRESAVTTAWGEVASRHSDMREIAPAMQQTLEARPNLANAILTADPAEKVELIENLYLITKGLQADAQTSAGKQVSDEHRESSRQAKVAAKVATGRATQGKGENSSSARLAKFKETMLEDSATDIGSGWS